MLNWLNHLDIENIQQIFCYISAEVGLVFIIMLLLFYYVWDHQYRTNIEYIKLSLLITIFHLLAIFLILLVLLIFNFDEMFFNNQLLINNPIILIKMFLLFIVMIIFNAMYNNIENEKLINLEIPILILLSVLGMFIVISSNDLFILILALELQTMPFFILVCLKKYSNISVEAGLKYFIFACFCSAISLYGVSLIYGLMGTTNFEEINTWIKLDCLLLENSSTTSITFIISCILVGFFFKLGIAPFHFWLPDVYEGAPTIITFFFAVVPKLPVLIALIKIFGLVFLHHHILYFHYVFIIFGLFSIIFGSIMALYQVKIKRLYAYSTIVHMGFIIIALGVISLESVVIVLYHMVIYIFGSMAFFLILLTVYKEDNSPITNIVDIITIAKTNSNLAIALSFILLFLAGIPPLGGFFGKCYIFYVLVEKGFYFIAIIVILTSTFSSIYYIRLIRMLWFSEEVGKNPIQYIQIIKPYQAWLISTFLFLNVFFIWLQVFIIIVIHEHYISIWF